MNWPLVTLIISTTMCAVAILYAARLIRRFGDWRIGFLAAMLLVFTLPQGFRILREFGLVRFAFPEILLSAAPVGLMSILTVVFLGQVLSDRQQTERSLAASERRFRALIENGWDGIALASAAGKALYTSPAVTQILGYSADELVGRTAKELTHPDDLDSVLGVFQGLTEAPDRPLVSRHRMRHKDGSWRWVEVFARNLLQDPAVGAIVGNVRDITDRKQAEIALEEERNLLRTLVDHIPDFIFIKDTRSRHVLNNAANLRLIGVPTEKEMVGKTVFDIYPRPQAQRYYDEDQRVMQSGVAQLNQEESVADQDGQEHWLLSTKVPVRDVRGVITGLVGIKRDITEQKRAQAALIASERRFRTLIENSSDGILLVDPAGTIIDNAPRTGRILGYTNVNFAGRSMYELVHPDDQNDVRAVFSELAAGKSEKVVRQLRALDADGGWRWIEAIAVNRLADPTVNAIVVNHRDITERKRAEESLRESETRLRLAVHAAGLGPWDWDVTTNEVYFSPEWKRQIGYEDHELPGRYEEWESRLHPDDRDATLAVLRAYLAGERPDYAVEFRLRHKDGSYRWIYTRGEVLRDSNGRPSRMLGCHLDITERKQLVHEIKEQQLLLASILDASRDGIAVEENDRIVFANRAFATLYGWNSPDELVGRHSSIVNSPQDNERMLEYGRRRVRGEPAPDVYEFTGKRRDGSLTPMEASVAVCEFTGRSYIVAIVRDITERKRVQDALLASEKRFRAFMDHLPAEAFIKDETGRYIFGSKCWIDQFAKPPAELFGKTDFELCPAELAKLFRSSDGEVLRTRKAVEVTQELERSPGVTAWYHVLKFPIEPESEHPLVGGIALDITLAKQAETAIRQYSEQLQRLSQRLLTAQEDERRQLARELHDEIGQVFTAISINLKTMSGKIDPSLRSQLDECVSHVDRAIDQIRNFSLELRPAVLDDFGLEAALRWFLNRLAERTGLVTHCTTKLRSTDLPATVSSACFRVAQESLTNVSRHAHARNVWLELEEEEGEILLTVRDDGRGFDVESARRRAAIGASLGLFSMQERAGLLGGQCHIQSAPDCGTSVFVRIPLAPADSKP